MTSSRTESQTVARAREPYPWKRALPALAIALLVAILRRPDAFLNPQFWAEDGSVFFVQANGLGTGALSLPHAGYHHLAMRLWAGLWIGADAPVVWMPSIFLAGAVLGWLAVAGFLFSPRVRSRWPEAMVAAMVLVPMGNETWFNLTDVQWVLALLWALWWLADDPRTIPAVAAESLAMAIVGLTGVFSIFAAPLMVWRAVRRRSGVSMAAAAICVCTAAVQFFAARAQTGEAAPATDSVTSFAFVLATLAKRVWGAVVLPAAFGHGAATWVGVTIAVSMLVGLAVAAWRSAKWRPLIGWVFFGGAILAATMVRFGHDIRPLSGFGGGERYFYVPQMLVVWGLIQTAAVASRGWRWGAIGLLICALATGVTRFRLPVMPDYNWSEWAARIEAGGDVGWVPITPEGMRFYYSGPPGR